MKKQIAILGSTGSIGTQALQVIEEHPDQYEAYVLTANHRVEELIAQARRHQPEAVVIADEQHYQHLKEALSDLPIKVYAGMDALCQIVQEAPIDMVLTAMVGYAGLRPTMNAIRARKPIALANKETLVVAGELINELARVNGTPILPVDSEHSAVFQCLTGEVGNPIEKVILTASGGPFRTFSREQLAVVTKEQALHHPNWQMGAKITIDSATMMNKGFEVIEARWLHASFPRLDLRTCTSLTFEQPDLQRFRNLALAYEALNQGGNMPCIVNAANEICVAAFLQDRISFLDMSDVIAEAMQRVNFIRKPTYEDYVQTDTEARRITEEILTNER